MNEVRDRRIEDIESSLVSLHERMKKLQDDVECVLRSVGTIPERTVQQTNFLITEWIAVAGVSVGAMYVLSRWLGWTWAAVVFCVGDFAYFCWKTNRKPRS